MDVAATAMSMPGQWGRNCFRPAMIAMVANEIITAGGVMVWRSPEHRQLLDQRPGLGPGA